MEVDANADVDGQSASVFIQDVHTDQNDQVIGFEFDIFDNENFLVTVSRTPFPYFWNPNYKIVHLTGGNRVLSIDEFNDFLRENEVSQFPYGNSPLGRLNWPDDP